MQLAHPSPMSLAAPYCFSAHLSSAARPPVSPFMPPCLLVLAEQRRGFAAKEHFVLYIILVRVYKDEEAFEGPRVVLFFSSP